jgi:hypothetical protein
MTKIRACFFAALAMIPLTGVGGQLAMANEGAPGPQAHLTTIARPADVVPSATAVVFQGMTAWTLPPASAGPPPSWPCFAPNAPCTADPAGGLLIGIPLQQWPISGTTNCTLVACGQIISTYQTTTGTGSVGVTITIKQGTTTIFSFSKTKLGTASANEIGIVDLTGVQLDTTAVAGNATITVTTTVGKSKVTGTATVVLQ